MASKVASIEIQAKSAGLSAQLREARAQFGSFADGVSQIFIDKANKRKAKSKGGMIGGMFGALNVAGGNLISGAVSKGVGYIENVGESVLDFEKNMTRFKIAARQTPAQIDAMRKTIDQLSVATGVNKGEILGAARAYVDLAGAGNYSEGIMKTIVRASQASGTAIGDVATVVYSLGDAMKIRPDEMEATLSGLINQSKDGAVHFNQFAAEIVGIAPRFARFGVTGREGVSQFGALFQVMRSGFKGSEEEATGLSGMLRGIGLHADRFADAGVQVYNVGKDGTKTFKPVLEIMSAISHSKLAKDPTLLTKAFGRGEGEQAFQMWSKHLDLFNELVEKGKASYTVQEDLAEYTQSSSGRMEIAMVKLKAAIASAFTPERIEKFVNAIERGAEIFGKLIGFLDKAASTIDSMYGGDEGVRDTVALKLSEGANTGDESERKRMIKLAQDAIADPTGEAARHMAMVATGGQASSEQMKAAVEGAKQYLKSEGVDMSGWGEAGGVRASGAAQQVANRTRQAEISAQGALKPNDIAKAVAAAIKEINFQVVIDGKPVATVVKQSPVHRHGVAK